MRIPTFLIVITLCSFTQSIKMKQKDLKSTSRNLRISDGELVGELLNDNQEWTEDKFDLGNFVGNNRGELVWGHGKNFKNTCRDCKIESGININLICYCSRPGRPKESYLALNHVLNNDNGKFAIQ